MIPRKLIGFSLAIILLFLWGCERESDDLPTGPPLSVIEFLESGWDNFEVGNYSQALADFNEAAARDAGETEAYLGLGWCRLRLQQYNLAISNASSVIQDIEANVISDPATALQYKTGSYACLAGAYQGLYPGDLENCFMVISSVDSVLANDANFIFNYDEDVNATSLIVGKADAYFALSDFNNALVTITGLDPDSTIYNNPDVLLNVIDVPIPVTILDSTAVTGFAKLIIPDAQLIDVTSIKRNVSGTDVYYQVESLTQGSNEVVFYGVPVPAQGNAFMVTYFNSPDFQMFMMVLRELIDSF